MTRCPARGRLSTHNHSSRWRELYPWGPMQLLCIRGAAYNRAMRMCATHGAEVMNCGPYCSPYDVPDSEGPDDPVNGGDVMPPPEMVNHAALDGLIAHDDEDPRPIVEGGADDDPATPE